MSKHGMMKLDEILATLNKIGGAERARKFRSGELVLVPRSPADTTRPLGEPVLFPAVTKFIAEDAFTEANGITWMGDNFKRFLLPIVEEGVLEAEIQVSEAIRDSCDLAIAAEVEVHKRGVLALAHFFHALQRPNVGLQCGGLSNGAFVRDRDGDTWVVHAQVGGVRWNVGALRLGACGWWGAGGRFLSR